MRAGASSWGWCSDSPDKAMTAQVVLAAAAAAAVRRAAFDRVGHDPLDGSRTAAAPGTAAQASIDLGGARRRFRVDYAAHILVGDHVAGADDHGWSGGTTPISRPMLAALRA